MTVSDVQAEIQQAMKLAETTKVAARAAIRAESGEYIFLTRAEVSAFVNALPPEVKVRWQVEPVMGSHRYRVTFWRSMWRSGGRTTGDALPEETTQP